MEFDKCRQKIRFNMCSIITFLFSAAFYIAPEFFTILAFPTSKGLALDVGITMSYFLAAGMFCVCCLLFQAKYLVRESDQKSYHLGAAIGFSAVCGTILYLTLFRGVGGSIPPIIATGLMALLNCLSWVKINSQRSRF